MDAAAPRPNDLINNEWINSLTYLIKFRADKLSRTPWSLWTNTMKNEFIFIFNNKEKNIIVMLSKRIFPSQQPENSQPAIPILARIDGAQNPNFWLILHQNNSQHSCSTFLLPWEAKLHV